MTRKLLVGLLLMGITITLGGGVWLVTLLLRGETGTAELVAVVRWLWVGLTVGPAIICVAAVILQLTRPSAGSADWTFTASLGAGLCLYALLIRPLLPREWSEALPGPLSWAVPVALSVGVAYAVLRPVLTRKPAEQVAAADRAGITPFRGM